MYRNEVIERLCALVAEVGERKFKHSVAHDCFCAHAHTNHRFDFQPHTLEYIEQAVRQVLQDDTPRDIMQEMSDSIDGVGQLSLPGME